MSKESRKKSSKTASRSPIRKQPARSNQTDPGRTRPAPARKSAQKPASASQTHASKPLTAAKASPTKADLAGVLAEGAKAPAFRLQSDASRAIALQDYAGRKLALFFYPRADTPGCTREAIDFTRLADAFEQAGTAVIGISADAPKAQAAFRDKHKLSVPLLSDETHEVLRAYGAWGQKSMYGKTFEGIIRSTFLIDADGRVARIWRKVRVDGHADEVLAAARAL